MSPIFSGLKAVSAVTPGKHLAEGLGGKKGEGIWEYSAQLSLNHPAAKNQTFVHMRDKQICLARA